MCIFSAGNFIRIVMFSSGVLFLGCVSGRSVHRPPDPYAAELRTSWADDPREYSLKSYVFESSALFDVFDYAYCMKHFLPEGPIEFRYDTQKTVDGRVLDTILREFIDGLRKTKRLEKEYPQIKLLKKTNFNPKLIIGSLIIKFKDYPFVAKLFFETPRTFVRPNLRDLEQRCLFYMGGGISRYLTGFTRLKNRAFIKERIEQDSRWKDTVDMPRKWFWVPQDANWFKVDGYNVNGIPEQHAVLPGVYGVIADALEAERPLSASNDKDKAFVFEFTHWLNQILDPNIANYMVEKGTGKIVFIDTEHFPTNLGLRDVLDYHKDANNLVWGLPRALCLQLAGKYMKDAFFRTKQERLDIRNGKTKPVRQVPAPVFDGEARDEKLEMGK